ncbi:MAG: hypothetical protein IJ043_04865 [Clostridia bacterium]|nr:hypothetical protein [Clostridia bacterium]
MKKQKWPIIIGAIVLVALIVGAVFLWKGLSAKPNEGSKALTFEVVLQDGSSKEHKLTTDAEYLANALVEAGLVEYAEDGMYNTIDGVTADWSKDESWWCISKDGEALSVGMNQQVIADGEHYEATYTIGF